MSRRRFQVGIIFFVGGFGSMLLLALSPLYAFYGLATTVSGGGLILLWVDD